MNNLQIFNSSEFGAIRTVNENDKILFCGSDIAKCLGYTNSNKALSDHCREDGVTFRYLTDALGREQQTKFIDEGNLYRLIAHSKLPAAEKFEKWVFDEVLPSIRKTGGYVADSDIFIHTYLVHADEATKALFKTTLEAVQSLNKKIESDKPKVTFADAVTASQTDILIGELAKILCQNGVADMGEKRFFDWLRKHGYLISRKGTDYNMPTQRSMEMKLFRIKETVISCPDGHTTISKTTKVTGKGQQYFINKFLKA